MMNLELSEQEARMVRSQVVRHLVELEDELARSEQGALGKALAGEIRTLREVYRRLTSMLDSVTPAGGLRAAAIAELRRSEEAF